ncbi:MAG: adenylate/guanylate cyclase domain-containing protein [Cyanobacteria bacterium P01_H01_bin.74]
MNRITKSQLKQTSETKILTLMVCDIRDFSVFVSQNSSSRVKALLNQYYGALYNIIVQQNHGVINKLIGDSILAYWDSENIAEQGVQAVKAGLAIAQTAQQWQSQDNSTIAVKIGCAINTGAVFIGHVGNEALGEFTVIGSDVNLTSKIEHLNKFFHTAVTLSEKTFIHIQDQMSCRFLSNVKFSADTEPINLYEPVALLPKSGGFSVLPKAHDNNKNKQPYIDWPL